MGEKPKMIPIVIGNYNKPELTEKCIKSIKENTNDYSIILVENGKRQTRKSPGVNYIKHNIPLGFTRAYNEGIRYARKYIMGWKHICLINNDVRVKKNWLPPLVRAINSEDVAMVAPLFDDPVNKYTSIPAHSDLIGGHILAMFNNEDMKGIKKTLSLNFTCVMIKREFIDDWGLVDESMVTFCSDLDYSLRATQAGWKCLVVKDSLVWHELGQTVNKLKDREEIKQKDQIRFLSKWSGIFLNDVLKEIPLDIGRKAFAHVTFLIADEDGTIINWGTGEKIKHEKKIVTEGVREQFENLKRMGIEQ